MKTKTSATDKPEMEWSKKLIGMIGQQEGSGGQHRCPREKTTPDRKVKSSELDLHPLPCVKKQGIHWSGVDGERGVDEMREGMEKVRARSHGVS